MNRSEPSTAGQVKQQTLDLARALLKAPGIGGENDRAQRLTPLIEALTWSVFRVVVMGEVKKGKSSFINALLGQAELLPVATDIATSTVYKITHGPAEKFTVFFLAPDDESTPGPAPQVISRQQLREFGTEDGNPGNAKRVDFIAVELPHPLLADGIVIVDTPGVGGLFKKHRDITFRYAPQADVVLFVLDSVEAVISQDEIRFLDELRKHTQHILFLQTKIDIAGTEQIEAWKKRNLEVLSKALDVDAASIPYFLVGAKLKQRADTMRDAECLRESGYLEVLEYIRGTLMPSRNEILARRWLPLLATELLAGGKQAADRLQIAREAHHPRMAEYESQLAEAEREFDRWQSEVWPGRLHAFQDATGTLKRESRNRLQDELSAENPQAVAVVEELRSKSSSVEEANELGDQLLANQAAYWCRTAETILEDFRRSFLTQVGALIGQISEDLAAIKLPELNVDVAQRKRESSDRVSAVREAAFQSNVFGGIVGESGKLLAYGAGVAAALGLISPVGWVVGAVAGVGYLATRIWMGVRGYKAAHERQREAAIAGFERALAKTAALAQRSALRIFEALAAELDSAARLKMDAFRTSTKRDFADRRQEILQARSRTAGEAKAAEENLRATLATYQDLVKQLQTLKLRLEPAAAVTGLW